MAIQIKRGTKAAMEAATLLAGEPAWATDTHQLFVGNGGTNYEVPTVATVEAEAEAAVEAKFDSELAAEVRAQILRIETGSVSITPDSIGVPKTAAIVFTEGRFTEAPCVFVNAKTSGPGTVLLGVSATNITASGCDIILTRKSLDGTTVQWFAIQEI